MIIIIIIIIVIMMMMMLMMSTKMLYNIGGWWAVYVEHCGYNRTWTKIMKKNQLKKAKITSFFIKNILTLKFCCCCCFPLILNNNKKQKFYHDHHHQHHHDYCNKNNIRCNQMLWLLLLNCFKVLSFISFHFLWRKIDRFFFSCQVFFILILFDFWKISAKFWINSFEEHAWFEKISSFFFESHL